MTDIEKLNNALRILNSISVPMVLLESVAIPIHNATIDIREVIQNAMQQAQPQNDSAEVQTEEVEAAPDSQE